jgi:hypothetical protein
MTALADAYLKAIRGILSLSQESEGELTPSDIDYDGFDIDELESFMETLGQ